MYISGGENVYPAEVEATLAEMEEIAEAAVVGVPDPLMGEEVLAFVALKAGATVIAEDIVAFCRERVAKYKCPKQVRFLDALPKNAVGKILRKELRTLATTTRGS